MTSDLSRGGREAGGQQRDKASDIKQQIQQTASDAKQQAQEKAGPAAAKVQEQVAGRLEGQRENAAQSLGGVAQALRQTSQQMRGQDQMGLTNYIEQAADQVERISGYLQNNDLGVLVTDVERFARRQPALFLGGAFLAGLIGARFLKSSRPTPQYDVDYYGPEGVAGYGYQRNPGAGYGATNYGTGEIPGVYRSTTASDEETLSRALGERLEG